MAETQKRPQKFIDQIPEGDDRLRQVCAHCDFIDYKNPKVVVGSVAIWDSRILLCKRAIEPRKGYWTLPAGYLELGETVEQGAIREAWEEARVALRLDQLLAVYSVPRISQVQVMFRAEMETGDFEAGPESEDVCLFAWDDIPWPEIAFPTAGWALRQWRATRDLPAFPPFSNPEDGI